MLKLISKLDEKRQSVFKKLLKFQEKENLKDKVFRKCWEKVKQVKLKTYNSKCQKN